MGIHKILSDLEQIGRERLAEAYAEIGGPPGPGIDIEVIPTKPASKTFFLYGLTTAGKGYLNLFYPDRAVNTGWQMRAFRANLEDWGLTFRVDWTRSVEEAS